MSRPAVTVGMPVYNEERLLPESISAFLDQDLRELQLLVADNGSTDGTRAVIERFASLDPRVTLVPSDVNRGAAWNHNRMVPLAEAPYFKWAAADDLHAPAFLRRCVEVLDARPEVVLCHTATVDIDEHRQVIGPLEYPWPGDDPDPVARFAGILRDTHPCVDIFGVMRLDVLRRTPLEGNYYAADRVLLAELALHGLLVQVDEPLFLHREHPDRSVRKLPDRYLLESWWDPSKAGAVSFPTWRYARESFRAVHQAPIDASTKARCDSEVARWCAENASPLARDLAHAGRVVWHRRGRQLAAA